MYQFFFWYIFSGNGEKRKNKQLDFIKLKSFCTAKETINQIKRQPTEWENTFSDTLNRVLISKIYKNLIKLNTKKKIQFKKWTKNLNRHFFQEYIQMSNRPMKRYSTLLIIREMLTTTTMRYHRTPVRMAVIHKSINNKFFQGCGERETFLYCGWECRLVQRLWKAVWRHLKKLKMDLPLTQQSHLWEYIQRNLKH